MATSPFLPFPFYLVVSIPPHVLFSILLPPLLLHHFEKMISSFYTFFFCSIRCLPSIHFCFLTLCPFPFTQFFCFFVISSFLYQMSSISYLMFPSDLWPLAINFLILSYSMISISSYQFSSDGSVEIVFVVSNLDYSISKVLFSLILSLPCTCFDRHIYKLLKISLLSRQYSKSKCIKMGII